ncbi:hypothetical protein M3J09_005146 [Ascochyta lentis]
MHPRSQRVVQRVVQGSAVQPWRPRLYCTVPVDCRGRCRCRVW